MAESEDLPGIVVKVCKILHNSQKFICACTTDGPYVVQKKIDKQQKGEKITAAWLNRCKSMYYVCRILRSLGRWKGHHFPMQWDATFDFQ